MIVAGSYYQWSNHEWMFWDVVHPEQALVILRDHEKFTRLVIEVADPTATIAAIESAIRAHKFITSPIHRRKASAVGEVILLRTLSGARRARPSE